MDESASSPDEMLSRLKRVNELSRLVPPEPAAEAGSSQQDLDAEKVDSKSAAQQTTPYLYSPKQPAEKPPLMVHQYEVLSELGRGGMGVVFKAHDTRLSRTVALKMLTGGAALDSQLNRRFAVEGEALAALDHPNVVPVYEARDWDGVPYYAMKHVAGGTLLSNAPRLRTDVRQAVAVMAKVARAVGYLHEHGISHRDLKPANILMGPNDEPLVADFGLAKFHNADSDLTVPGCMLGTRFYMSPEQTRGHHPSLTTACDIWSVGIVMYELLTGKVPFMSDEYEELYRIIRVNPPPPMTSLSCERKPELEAIVFRCLSKNPAARYPTGTALAEDLERWLAGEKVQAEPAAKSHNTAAVIFAALAASVLLAMLVSAIWKGNGGARADTPPPQSAGDVGPPAPTRIFIGPGVSNYQMVVESDIQVQQEENGLFLTSGKTGLVKLAAIDEKLYPKGYVIEATVQVLESDCALTYAGIYFRGRFHPIPDGLSLNCGTFGVDVVEPADVKVRRPVGYAMVAADIWDTQVHTTWQHKIIGDQVATPRAHLRNGMVSSIITLKVEVLPDGSTACSIRDGLVNTVTMPKLEEQLGLAGMFNPRFTAQEGPKLGSEIGLYVQTCKARFWDVKVTSKQ